MEPLIHSVLIVDQKITYVGGATTGDRSDDVRGFEVNPGGTGNIIVTLEKTSGIRNVSNISKGCV